MSPTAPLAYRSPWMNEELDDLRTLARRFCEDELAAHIDRFHEQHAVDREVWTKAGELGLLGLSIPEEYGGGGGTFAHEAVVALEQARAGDDSWGFVVHSIIVMHYVLAYGTEEQKKRWLPKMCTGEMVGAVAMTEPGAGSDLKRVRTRAVRDGDDFVVNGSKTFITNAGHADLIVVVARTGERDPKAGHKGISLLVVETDGLEGFERGRVLQKIGQHGQDTRELHFTDMRVPVENVLGEEGRGFYHLMEQLPQERLGLACTAVGSAELAIELGVEHAKSREMFDGVLMDLQNTRFVLAECSTDVLAARTLLDHCIGLHVNGDLDSATASRAKFWTTDVQCNVIDRVLQLFGGYGFMSEYPIAKMYAGARIQKIYGGANEVMKELVARSL